MKRVDLGNMDYDGSQLHHAFAYEQRRVLGPSICVFRGAANVKEHLVDLEDSLADDFIKSEEMWHFIIEIPGATITEMVVWQRLFIFMCIDHLRYIQVAKDACRIGDDIMIEPDESDSYGMIEPDEPGGEYDKLSVSIATLSRFSGLIHVGININVGEGCPVEATGLKDFVDQKDVDLFGKRMASNFVCEYNNIIEATYKVTEVK